MATKWTHFSNPNKKSTYKLCKCLILLVGARGFEPPILQNLTSYYKQLGAAKIPNWRFTEGHYSINRLLAVTITQQS